MGETNSKFYGMMEGLDIDFDSMFEDGGRQARIDKARNSSPQSLERFNVNDTVILSLIGEPTIDGAPIPLQLIVGYITNKEKGILLIEDVKSNVEIDAELEQLKGKEIGIAYAIELTKTSGKIVKAAVQKRIAGNHEAAYYLASDMISIGFGESAPNTENIRYPALKFGKAMVAGAVLFDFITPENYLQD